MKNIDITLHEMHPKWNHTPNFFSYRDSQRDFFSMCFSLVSKKQKFPLKRTTFFTLTLFSKNKGTMDKRVTEELHVRVFFSLSNFLKKKLEHTSKTSLFLRKRAILFVEKNVSFSATHEVVVVGVIVYIWKKSMVLCIFYFDVLMW